MSSDCFLSIVKTAVVSQATTRISRHINTPRFSSKQVVVIAVNMLMIKKEGQRISTEKRQPKFV